MSRQVAIVTLGCKTNQFESAAMSEQLKGAGYQLVEFEQGAELVIVNTCTVTAATDSQSRNLIRRAQRLNPRARVVVTGCYAQVDGETLAKLPGVALVIGNEEKQDFLGHLTRMDEGGQLHVSDIRRQTKASPLALSHFEQRSRAFVQIQNGCDAFCSYCIIPYARGRSRSVKPLDVVTQVRKLVAAGHAEVVLTGIHIGNYGQDLQPTSSLLELLQAIAPEIAPARLRLGSLEPTEIPVALRDYVAAAEWICPHYHIPLQAGEDRILKRMNRHYDTTFFAELIADLHRRQPRAAIGLDLIVGFPGESEDLFASSYQFVSRLPISHLHVFPYSRRPGTPAAEMPDQVPGGVARERAARLRRLGEEKQRAFSRRFVGQPLQIVLEGGEKEGLRKGLSENYLPVWVPADVAEPGALLRVRAGEPVEGDLLGTLLR